MQVLNDTQRKEVLNGLMDITVVSKDLIKVEESFKKAAKKFSLKFSKSKKNTLWEDWNLNTTYLNSSEVSNFLTHVCGVFCSVSNGRVNFAAGFVKNIQKQ